MRDKQVRPMPKDDHDALNQIWTVLIGINGHGLVTRFDDIEKSVDRIECKMNDMVTVKSCQVIQNREKRKYVARWVTLERVILLAIAVFGALKGFGIF